MLETASYESRRRLRRTLALAVGLGAFAIVIVAVFPSIEASGVDFEAYVESLPPAFKNAFGVEAFGTIEGFLAAEFYQFVWVLLLGLYLAYAAAGSVAGKVEDGRIELVLSGPVSRTRYLLETYASLLVPVFVLNVLAAGFVLAGLVAIGVVFLLFLLESVTAGSDLARLGAVSPTRYYDPTAVLVQGEYDAVGAAILLGATAVALAVARAAFVRRDL